MRLTILGSGTSTGVPLIQCDCVVCQSKNPRNQRLRASAWIQFRNKSFLIDTSTDLRQQVLRSQISRIDAVLYTHPHADHLHGIDELRSFNFIQKQPIPVYGNEWTCAELVQRFPYIFQSSDRDHKNIPLLQMNQFNASSQSLEVSGETWIPLSLCHGSKESVGYRIQSLAYVTDCHLIPPATLERMRDLSILILDCVRLEKHFTHFNLEQALETVEQLKPKKTFLTHLGHDFDYSSWQKKLPRGVYLAYDGLAVDFA